MAGLVPAIHAAPRADDRERNVVAGEDDADAASHRPGVDGRDKPGHDEAGSVVSGRSIMKAFWTALLGGVAMLAAGAAVAEGDLALKPIKLDDLIVGQGEAGYGVSKKDFELVTGKAYRLLVKSTGNKECAWESPALAANIWLRKVEAGGIEIKAAHLIELEFEKEGEAEIFFVPIRTGTFAWRCRGLEARGVSGNFIVK
jgi:hypothetical protein